MRMTSPKTSACLQEVDESASEVDHSPRPADRGKPVDGGFQEEAAYKKLPAKGRAGGHLGACLDVDDVSFQKKVAYV